ncbi:hypothetical protein PGT21_034012 [Puccinia graminis f. sp. tritici]|uniref:Uncharacterized protein n=1 Tax=Puccinia graminis f. sp. tritici TaxID=56615 RepID=A0A5B0Q8Y3_PUCGR|nr:hypothetical protein PGT21_034012 [Puccinia graminis f. sp. tritici]KAA1109424.1 hypothetical protein PGTUg99_033043 [Puccinia graminis f. sp. tritici]
MHHKILGCLFFFTSCQAMDDFNCHPFKPFGEGTTKAVGESHATMRKTSPDFHLTGDPDILNRSDVNHQLTSSDFDTFRSSVSPIQISRKNYPVTFVEGRIPDDPVTGIPTEITGNNPKLRRKLGQRFKQKSSDLIDKRNNPQSWRPPSSLDLKERAEVIKLMGVFMGQQMECDSWERVIRRKHSHLSTSSSSHASEATSDIIEVIQEDKSFPQVISTDTRLPRTPSKPLGNLIGPSHDSVGGETSHDNTIILAKKEVPKSDKFYKLNFDKEVFTSPQRVSDTLDNSNLDRILMMCEQLGNQELMMSEEQFIEYQSEFWGKNKAKKVADPTKTVFPTRNPRVTKMAKTYEAAFEILFKNRAI